ncbi:helix-turn-helix and ligand-binding sensor domain-containing protein [Sphingobacterium faecium]|uniref:helix-turn-helix and ligand-binding sensor domain-containing protein n=1 Tax=Sphingobacterium faecium TaxID=34087 RepID=UPI0024686054|nr:triple tyrosine motif-containing protein [Sphingobacterium faecium]MDH5826447.1 transcriptional regulator [Sphingobacterium faecium]
MKFLLKSFFTLFLLLFSFITKSLAGDIQYLASPWVQQYSKSTYQAGNQNWGLSVDQEGLIYAANSEGLLVYDGAYWNLHPHPNKGIVRVVQVHSDGKIYTGGQSEFGYWEKNDKGRLAYHSISSQLLKNLNDEIWKIIIQDNRIIFQSFSTIYIYENKKIRTITGDGEPFLFAFQTNKRIFIEKIPSGLHELKNNTLIPVAGKDRIKGSNILSILPFDTSSFLIGTAKSGLFLMDKNGNIAPWENAINEELKNAQINNGIKLLGQYYVYGTILNGVYILDQSGHLVQHINKSVGLQNNTVLSLSIDKQSNIWTGLDNGIDRIAINADLYYYSDKSGKLGTIYSAKIYQGFLYLGTNQGLFYTPWNQHKKYQPIDFKMIAGSQGQVWNLEVINEVLVCGHNTGTFQVKGTQMSLLSPQTGGWVIKQLSPHFPTVLQGNYTGISLFHSMPNALQFSTQYPNFKSGVQLLETQSKNNVWAAGYNELNLITFSDNFDAIKQIKPYAQQKGLPRSANIGVFKLADINVFTTDSGLYLYDELADKFTPYDHLNKKLGTFAKANKITAAGNNSYWFINQTRIALVDLQPGGKIQIDSIKLAPLEGNMMKYYENITALNPKQYLISIDNGFSLLNLNRDNFQPNAVPIPLIRNIRTLSGTDSIYFNSVKELVEIKHKNNSIRISYALPYYTESAIQYQYKLNGVQDEWSDWTKLPYKEFTNLAVGNYSFVIRAKLPNGYITKENKIEIEILPPWYRTWYAYLAYLIGLVFMTKSIRIWYKKKLVKHEQKLREDYLVKQDELLKQEAVRAQQHLIEVKNKQLEQELYNKNKELTNATMNIVHKNELLNSLNHELSQLKDENGNKLKAEQLQKVAKILKNAYEDNMDWHLFEQSFNETHENFFKKLKLQFPELMPNDLKLCAYLRLNMSSKEIASLLNITTRGVEIRRYRLRKKLNLPTEQNLSDFLMNIN